MRNFAWPAITLVLGCASAIVGSSTVSAAPITYTETAVVSGSLNGVGFSNATIVLTENGDTTNITGSPGFFTNRGTITITINGAPATITEVSSAFVAQVPEPGVQIRAGFESDFANEDIRQGVATATTDHRLPKTLPDQSFQAYVRGQWSSPSKRRPRSVRLAGGHGSTRS